MEFRRILLSKAYVVSIFIGGFTLISNASACTTQPTSTPLRAKNSVSSASYTASGNNVGIYEWNAALGQYSMIESYYDPSVSTNYLPDSDETDVTPSSWNNRGGGGGGRPPVHQQGLDCDPVDLPTVTAIPPPTTHAFIPTIRLTITTGIGGAFRMFRSVRNGKAPNNPNNLTRAVCTSDGDERYFHAASDFALWRLNNFGAAVRAGRGERVTIEFDDGGTEQYSWIRGRFPSSTISPETYLARVPNTLKCPN